MLRKFCGKFLGIARIRDQEARRAAEDEKPPSVMMVTLTRRVGRYGGMGLAGGMGHVQKDRDNNLGSGVSDAGYCLSAGCADGSRDRSHDDYHQGWRNA